MIKKITKLFAGVLNFSQDQPYKYGLGYPKYLGTIESLRNMRQPDATAWNCPQCGCRNWQHFPKTNYQDTSTNLITPPNIGERLCMPEEHLWRDRSHFSCEDYRRENWCERKTVDIVIISIIYLQTKFRSLNNFS